MLERYIGRGHSFPRMKAVFLESDLFSRVSREIVIICRVYQLKQKKIPCQSNIRRPALFNLTNANRHCSRFKYVIHRFVIN